ncbi:MAG: peptidylprolyl isomerase [Ferruginibacter sp.]
MKFVITILVIFLADNLVGQALVQKLTSINTTRQAKRFIAGNTQLEGSILQIDTKLDSLKIPEQLYLQTTGDIVTIGTNIYKVLADKATILSRVNYIFLDGAQLSISQIDTVKKFILQQYKKGVPFDSLAAKFTMDGNKKFGDTGWYADGLMAKEFSDAVKAHTLSDVFLVDVTSSNWYFVIKKTFDEKQFRQMTILQLKDK